MTKQWYDMTDEDKTLAEKVRLIKKLEDEHFKYHHWADLNDFVAINGIEGHTNAGVAKDIMQTLIATGRYERIKSTEDQYSVGLTPKKSWKDKYWFPLIIAGFIIGWFADLGKDILKEEYLQKSKQEQIKSEQAIQATTDTSHIEGGDNREVKIAIDTSKKSP